MFLVSKSIGQFAAKCLLSPARGSNIRENMLTSKKRIKILRKATGGKQ
jgi:hypothetical protein